MSDGPMKVSISTTIDVSVVDLVDGMTANEIAELLNAVALRLDRAFEDRAYAAQCFADHMSEKGNRFLAEIVSQRAYLRGDSDALSSARM